MDACRLNMSHCSHEMGRRMMDAVRGVERDLTIRIPVGIDLRGPKLRIGEVEGGALDLRSGSSVIVVGEGGVSNSGVLYVEYPSLADDLQPDSVILLHDGFISLRVEDVHGQEVLCRVVTGGQLLPRKGVNLPGISLKVPSVTPKDLADIEFACDAGADFLFVSYARSAQHIKDVRAAVAKHGQNLPIVAKIERGDGVKALEEIADEADGVCVARGDLGIEVPIARVPRIQREAARLCAQTGKFAMIGGQILSSMTSSPVPLRAEVADLASVVRDGLDAVVLSDETASGEYPVEAVSIASAVFEAAESYERQVGDLRPGPRLAAPVRI